MKEKEFTKTQHGSYITTRDGTEIYYKDWGDGPVVTFSHGWPLNSDSWESQMMFLASHGYRCIAHDRRGHGRSAPNRPTVPASVLAAPAIGLLALVTFVREAVRVIQEEKNGYTLQAGLPALRERILRAPLAMARNFPCSRV